MSNDLLGNLVGITDQQSTLWTSLSVEIRTSDGTPSPFFPNVGKRTSVAGEKIISRLLSARDLHRFGLALLRHRLLDSISTNVVTTGIVDYRPGARYGYGFANELVDGRRIVFHDGGADGISTNLDLIPERGLIAIVLANLDPPAARPIRDALRAEMLSPHRSNGESCH